MTVSAVPTSARWGREGTHGGQRWDAAGLTASSTLCESRGARWQLAGLVSLEEGGRAGLAMGSEARDL